MKTKIALTALLSVMFNAFHVNGEIKGTIDTGYTSEYHRRGAIVSQDAAQVGLSVNKGALFGSLFTNQSVDGGDTLEAVAGFNVPVSMLDLYVGVYNTDIDLTGSTLEMFVTGSVDMLLSPSVTIYRDVSDELYTFDLQLTDSFTVKSIDVEVVGTVGSTDVSDTDTVTYTGLSVTGTKNIKKNVDLYVTVAASDTDERDVEYFSGAGVAVKF